MLIFSLISRNIITNMKFLRQWRRMEEIRNNADLRVSVVKKLRLLL